MVGGAFCWLVLQNPLLRPVGTHYDSILAVTESCRDARSERPFPLKVTSSSWFDNGRPPPTSSCFLSSYASKKRSFFSFRKLGRLLGGEPLGGVGAPTVGADLCVRPSSPERSLFCGRTRRSAPTQATSARQFHSSNAVTSICRNARLVRPLYQRLWCQYASCRSTTDARPSVPTKGYTSRFDTTLFVSV